MKKLFCILLCLCLCMPMLACGRGEPVGTCTVSISVAGLLGHEDELKEEKRPLVPADGWILPPTDVPIYEGESAFDVLQRVTREQKLHMEFSKTPVYNSAYVEGIGNLYEFDCGPESGWMFRVDGQFPNVSASEIEAADGMTIEWAYTRSRGADLGESWEGQP